MESQLLAAIGSAGEIPDSGKFASEHGVEHDAIVSIIKSLSSADMIAVQDIDHFRLRLTPEAEGYLELGTPEARVFEAVGSEGKERTALLADLGVVGELGFKQAMQRKWIALDKQGLVTQKVDKIEDTVQNQLWKVADGMDLPKADVDALKKRKLVVPESWKTYRLTKGPQFALERKKPATDLTHDMLAKGTWRDAPFKAYNFNALGQQVGGGYLHPLMKVRTQFRKIFTQLGFEEMPTNNYVESSFWNFDALFQPQQHPARDAHDTFFLTNPAATDLSRIPQDYLERVRRTHESGGYGSTGYGYHWKEADAAKNLLRTHTTAVSSRMLYKLAQEGFRPAKYFSIDRVFRNEAIDRTHLAEFHQIEGVVCDKGLTLADLIGTLQLFFQRLGLPKLRFKPAYNPYTEPSMEIFSYSEQLGKWIEVGNSGMFRPEMLRPMGLPEGVNVIAWGLGLERPTMILYGIDNIRDLFGYKVRLRSHHRGDCALVPIPREMVSLATVRQNPICRLGF